MKNDFNIINDIETTKELLNMSYLELANDIDVSYMSLTRWMKNPNMINKNNIDNIYRYIYHHGIRLNKIKELLYKEEYSNKNSIVLFHGAKSSINGKISLSFSKFTNDFGNGFYCGESLEQSTMFVSSYPASSLYIIKFNKDKSLKKISFDVSRDWMLTIAYFRGALEKYKNHKIIKNLINKLQGVDYLIAPIADNRMFDIIDDFANGEISDIQCEHALSITSLGYQYVFISQKAIDNIKILEHCYLVEEEKNDYIKKRYEENKINIDKSKIARREYRNKGQYIDEILK